MRKGKRKTDCMESYEFNLWFKMKTSLTVETLACDGIWVRSLELKVNTHFDPPAQPPHSDFALCNFTLRPLTMCRCLLHVRFSCQGKHISPIFHAFSHFSPYHISSALSVTLVLLDNTWNSIICMYTLAKFRNPPVLLFSMIFKVKAHYAIGTLRPIKF